MLSATGIFETGKTVTIELFDAIDGSAIPLDAFHRSHQMERSLVMNVLEIGTTGIFRWPSFIGHNTCPCSLHSKPAFIYAMTDNSTIPVVRREMIDALGWSAFVVEWNSC